MANKKSSDSRRKLLKSIAAGSGAVVAGKSLPENWIQPVVDSVVLPTHAATTSCSIFSATGFAGSASEGLNRPVYVCAVVNGDTAVVTHETFISGTAQLCIRRRQTLSLDGTPEDMTQIASGPTCGDGAGSVPGMITKSGNSLIYTLLRTQGSQSSATTDLVMTLNCVGSCLQPIPSGCEPNCDEED